jgi:hypothetical protein
VAQSGVPNILHPSPPKLGDQVLQLGRVWQMAHDVPDRVAYEGKITSNFGDQLEFDFGASRHATA